MADVTPISEAAVDESTIRVKEIRIRQTPVQVENVPGDPSQGFHEELKIVVAGITTDGLNREKRAGRDYDDLVATYQAAVDTLMAGLLAVVKADNYE